MPLSKRPGQSFLFRRIMRFLFILLFVVYTNLCLGQENEKEYTEKIWRINFFNPSIELELPTNKFSTFSAGLGVGYGGSYPDLSKNGNGLRYMITPFLDLQEKWFYNFQKREEKDKNIKHNSANFISARLLVRGNKIAGNFSRTSNFDFAFGPTWGIQRNYGNFHLLFDVGTIYYFDIKGNGNWFPLMLQLNLGFDL